MQKSLYNSPENYSFTFNLLCVGIYNLNDYFNDKLTLSTIRPYLKDYFLSERIGNLCRGRDYWWNISEDFLHLTEQGLEQYYNNSIQNDIIKSAVYLDELAAKKAKKYLSLEI